MKKYINLIYFYEHTDGALMWALGKVMLTPEVCRVCKYYQISLQ